MLFIRHMCHAALLPFVLGCWSTAVVQGGDSPSLRISVVRGEGAFNDARKRTPTDLAVEVRDDRGRPVSGVSVTFTAPEIGPSGTFPSGGRTARTITGDNGRAQVLGFRPNTMEGRFQILVRAHHQGEEATAVIPQTNTTAARSVSKQGGSRKKLLILGLAGGAAAIAIRTSRGGGSEPRVAAPPQPTVVSISGVSVGGPR